MTVILGAGLLALALAAPVAFAQAPAADPAAVPASGRENAGTVPPNGAGLQKAGEDEGELDLAKMFRVRARVIFNAYNDLEIKSRSISTNELGLSFAQPTVSEQNSAEEKSWSETTEVVELLCDIFGAGDQGAWLFFGIGGRQNKMDFGTESVKMEPTHPGVFSFGALGSLGDLSRGVRLDWEARFTYSKTDASDLDQIADVSETLKDTTMTYAVKLVAAFDLGEAGRFEDSGVGVEPYLGILYQHISIDEVYTATATSPVSGTSKFKFDVQSPAKSDVQAVLGLRLLGLEPLATVDLEGTLGAEVYGASFSVNIRF
jgi:hypothetical protein